MSEWHPGEIVYMSDTRNTEMVQPTNILRIKAGVLQQTFETLIYHGGCLIERRAEWRDVPIED